jgi:hypothetical protein
MNSSLLMYLWYSVFNDESSGGVISVMKRKEWSHYCSFSAVWIPFCNKTKRQHVLLLQKVQSDFSTEFLGSQITLLWR